MGFWLSAVFLEFVSCLLDLSVTFPHRQRELEGKVISEKSVREREKKKFFFFYFNISFWLEFLCKTAGNRLYTDDISAGNVSPADCQGVFP